MNIYDRATITALHHYQNINNMQKTHKAITTISRITRTDNTAFINEVKTWSDTTRDTILEQLHPGTYGILGSWTGDIFKIAIGLLLTPPIIYLLVLFVRLSIMCIRQGISCNTVAAIWKGFKFEFMDSKTALFNNTRSSIQPRRNDGPTKS